MTRDSVIPSVSEGSDLRTAEKSRSLSRFAPVGMTKDAAIRPASRVESVDLLRGVIMIVMALDHTRDFFGNYNVNPTDLATTTIPMFFTRWITHLCAPVFALLVGTGAYLALR